MKPTKIDFSKNYRIESVPSKDQEELRKKGVGVYPGSTFTYTVTYDHVLGRYKNTGLDINAPEVLRLEKAEREDIQKWIKETKQSIESLIGIPDYLDVTKDGWTSELAVITVEVGQDLKIRVNGHDNVLKPSQNHKDQLALLILYNDPNFPKSKHDLDKPEFRNAKFYLTTDGEISEINKNKVQKNRKANVLMAELFDNAKDSRRAWEIAYYMELVKKQNVNAEELELYMDSAIKDDETRDKFIEACELDNATLLLYNMFQKAIAFRIVQMSPDGYWHRGHTNYRKTKKDSVDYLLTPAMTQELADLRDEVAKKSKKQNALA